MSGKLILLASYPKSGNTWVRLFFETLRRGRISINDIGIGLYGFQRRRLFDTLAPADAADLTPNEIENWLPDVFADLAIQADGPVFLKVHDACRRTPDGRWLFPPEHVGAVIYLLRHPFDVAISYAHHLGIATRDAAADLCDEDHVIAKPGSKLVLPLFERAGSWSTNVESWTDRAPYPVTPFRYEDLCAEPAAAFAKMAVVAGCEVSPTVLRQAIEATAFERLKADEIELGFRERPSSSSAFFRHGKPNTWNGMLDEASRTRLIQAHRSAMRRFAYSDI